MNLKKVYFAIVLTIFPIAAQADIYQWEWIDPANTELGKKQSTTLCPSGRYKRAAPFAIFISGNFTKAYLIGANISSADCSNATFSEADMSSANLTNVIFYQTNLINAVFTDANIYGAGFENTTSKGFTEAQLKSTSSYKNKDLSEIILIRNNLSVWDFHDQNLTNTNFGWSTLTNAIFTNAEVRGANFQFAMSFSQAQLQSTISYQMKDLSGIKFYSNNLSGWNFHEQNLTNSVFQSANLTEADFTRANLTKSNCYSANLTGAVFNQANLTNASFYSATLTDAIFADSDICGATFANTTSKGFTEAQLYSTASYQAKDLSGIQLSYNNNLNGWDFHEQNLTKANFSSSMVTNTIFTNAEVRGANFGNTTSKGFTQTQLQSTSSYQRKDLSEMGVVSNDLSGWDFHDQNLTKASFSASNLTNTIFTNANIRGAFFYNTTAYGFTQAQLQSTASYQSKDLAEINLGENNLNGWDFHEQNLTSARFQHATLTNADFTKANLTKASFFAQTTLANTNFTDAEINSTTFQDVDFTHIQLQSTASYKAKNISEIRLYGMNLTGWDFHEQNLTNAFLRTATLTDTIFTDAEIRGANLYYTTSKGFTQLQLQSTTSYKAKDLSGIVLANNDLSGWDFHEQNLTNVDFSYSNLTGVNFTNSLVRGVSFERIFYNSLTKAQLESTASYKDKILSGIIFSYNDFTGWEFQDQMLTNTVFTATVLTDADLSGADLRGAINIFCDYAITNNTIHNEGIIKGLDLSGGKRFLVRDFDGDPSRLLAPIPITLQTSLNMGMDGSLKMIFEEDAWDSKILFQQGITVSLGGTLELTFADEVNVPGQIGRTFSLFDWSNVNPTGIFNVTSPYVWDLSNLYTSGNVTLMAIPEPTAIAMLILAIVCLISYRLHRQSRK